MKKVLIVDDEFLVRLGLKMTLDWTAYGYEIAAEAGSVEEALTIVEQQPIDILMTDIKMQGMNGLDLIEKVKRSHPEIRTIIFTNHDDFYFARRAVALGAEQYILKSEISPDSLLSFLSGPEAGDAGMIRGTQLVRQKEERYLDEQLLKLKAADDPGQAVCEDCPKGLFMKPPYLIAAGYCSIRSLPEGSVGMLMEMLTNLSAKLFGGNRLRFLNLKDYVSFLMVCPECDTPADKGASLIRQTGQYLNTDIYLGFSRPGARERFPRMFREAEEARQECFFQSGKLCVYDETLERPPAPKIHISASKIRASMGGGKDEAIAYINHIFEELRTVRNYSMVLTAFIDFLSISKALIENYDTTEVPGLSAVRFQYNNFYALSHIDQVQMYIVDVYEAIWNFFHNQKHAYSSVIKHCIAYIEENYANNITLDNAAAAVHISSSYLSLIFKQETGINFSTFLTNYRVEMSKQLMRGSNLKVYEIAGQVGFASPYYFSKVFKEITNMTCKEFKNKYT